MTDYVLVQGAWHGGWCWSRVRDRLAAEGHRVFTPTLTGLGERVHLLNREINLETHIADITNLILYEDLQGIILVGHSYGGLIVRHVADRMPERIHSLIYLDAFVPDNGKSLSDYLPDSGAIFGELAAGPGEGWKVAPFPASYFSVNAADAAWVDRQCVPHPLSTLEAPARLSGACDGLQNIGYVRAAVRRGLFDQFYVHAGERGWWRAELPCGHDAMIDMPQELTVLLLQPTARSEAQTER